MRIASRLGLLPLCEHDCPRILPPPPPAFTKAFRRFLRPQNYKKATASLEPLLPQGPQKVREPTQPFYWMLRTLDSLFPDHEVYYSAHLFFFPASHLKLYFIQTPPKARGSCTKRPIVCLSLPAVFFLGSLNAFLVLFLESRSEYLFLFLAQKPAANNLSNLLGMSQEPVVETSRKHVAHTPFLKTH